MLETKVAVFRVEDSCALCRGQNSSLRYLFILCVCACFGGGRRRTLYDTTVFILSHTVMNRDATISQFLRCSVASLSFHCNTAGHVTTTKTLLAHLIKAGACQTCSSPRGHFDGVHQCTAHQHFQTCTHTVTFPHKYFATSPTSLQHVTVISILGLLHSSSP